MIENTLAVTSQSGCSLSFFNLSTGERISQITNLIREPHEICHDKKRNLLYLSHPYRDGHYLVHEKCSCEITVVDVEQRKVIDVIYLPENAAPHGFGLDPIQDILYVTVESLVGFNCGGLQGIDLNTRKVVKSIPCDYKPHWFSMTQDYKKAFTTNKEAKFVSVLDLEHSRLSKKITVPGSEEPAISHDGKTLYVPTPEIRFGSVAPDTGVTVINTETESVVDFIKTDLPISSVHVTAGGKLMVGQCPVKRNEHTGRAQASPGQLALYNANDLSLLGVVEVGLVPLTLRSSADGSTGFVANLMSGTVTVIDLDAMQLVRTIEVDLEKPKGRDFLQGAHGMALLRV